VVGLSRSWLPHTSLRAHVASEISSQSCLQTAASRSTLSGYRAPTSLAVLWAFTFLGSWPIPSHKRWKRDEQRNEYTHCRNDPIGSSHWFLPVGDPIYLSISTEKCAALAGEKSVTGAG
jgi:hypothetical protein